MKSLNATHYEVISTYPSKKERKHHVVHAIIETPKDSCYKFALDAERGIIALHEALPDGYRWPFDYGFIPQTLGDDGDPLDILVMLNEPTFSGCLMKVRLLGAIRLRKNGTENDRFIAAPPRMPGVSLETDPFETLHDIGAARRKEIESFLCGYSESQGNRIDLVGTVELDEAADLVNHGHKTFARKRR